MTPKMPCGDEALKRQTGRDWAAWFALLDRDGAAKLTHQQIAEIVHGKYNGGSWWSQMITVGYERARGLRVVAQQRDGTFSASASRTLPVAAGTAHAMFTDSERCQNWLGETAVLRTAVPPKSVRLTWPDGTIVAVFITAKGDDKCSVSVDHGGLTDGETADHTKAWWKVALERLQVAVQQKESASF